MRLDIKRVVWLAVSLLLTAIIVGACAGPNLPTTGNKAIGEPTSSQSPAPLASSTSLPVPSLALSPTIEPTLPSIDPTAELVWLTPVPLINTVWKSYHGHVENKTNTFTYEFSYPADWYFYPDEVQVQTFPRFDGLTPEPPGFKDGYMKIDVAFEPCDGEAGKCRLAGTPVSVAGQPAVAEAHPDEVVPGLQIRTVAVPYGTTVLRMTAFMRGDAERIKYYEQVFGHMISTLVLAP